jgi:hypothetical protein
MNLTQFGLILSAMATAANNRAEYYTTRNSHGGKPAPAAEAVAWTLRAILVAGATRCQQLAEEEEKRNG